MALTPEEARAHLCAGRSIRMTVEPGHELIVRNDNGCVVHEVVKGDCAGCVEPVTACEPDNGYLLAYLSGKHALELDRSAIAFRWYDGSVTVVDESGACTFASVDEARAAIADANLRLEWAIS